MTLASRFPELDATYAGLLDAAAAGPGQSNAAAAGPGQSNAAAAGPGQSNAARSSGAPPILGLPPEAMRGRVRAGDALCAPGPEMLKEDDVKLGPVTVRRYVPRRPRATDRVLVWFHGGGWVTGDLGYSAQFCRMLADGAGCEVCNVDYRLAPEHPFPAAVEDALAAARWAASGGREVVVGGDSAGGNLAAVAARELPGCAGQLLVYPVLDTDRSRPSYLAYDGLVLGVAEMGWFFDQYLPREQDRVSARAAPLRAPGLDGLPPAIVAVAGHDPLRDEGVAYASRLCDGGVRVTLLEFPSLPHGFLRFTGPVAAAAEAAGRIVATAAGELF